MSYNRAKWIRLGKDGGVFSSGYVDNTQNLYQADNTSPYLRNARSIGSAITVRPGRELFATLTTSTTPKGISAYQSPVGEMIVVRNNQTATSKLVSITEGGTKTDITTGTQITSDNRMFFQDVGRVLYCMNGVDNMGELRGLEYDTSNTGIEDFNPAFSAIFNSSHFVAGLTGYTPAYLTGREKNLLTLRAALVSVSNGGFGITIDGVFYDITGMDFTGISIGISGLIDAGDIIEAKIRSMTGNTETVGFYEDGSNANIEIKSSDVTYITQVTNTIPPSVGTDIGTNVFLGTTEGIGTEVYGVNKANIVYKSKGNEYSRFIGVGSDQFTFPEEVTGLYSNSQSIFYFTKNSISVTDKGDIQETNGELTYITRPIRSKEGAVNHASIVGAGNATYFITPSKKICRLERGALIDGFEVYEISDRKYAGISTLLSTLNIDDCWGYYLPNKNLIKWQFKTTSSFDIAIIYDIQKDCFFIDNSYGFLYGDSLNGINYTISSTTNKVYKDEYGTTDEGSAILLTYYTKEFYLSDPTYKKIIWESRTLLDINASESVVQKIYIDGVESDTKTINSAGGTQEISIIRTKGNLNQIGKKFQWRYTCSSSVGNIVLKDIQALFEIKPPITNNI